MDLDRLIPKRTHSPLELELDAQALLAEKKSRQGFRLRQAEGMKGRTNDDVHSSIEICPVTAEIMGTAQFHRLQEIKQLETCEYSISNMNQTVFEHAVGMAHLAEKMCKRIKEEQPKLELTDKDVLCVKLAGLLYYLGQLPYASSFEPFLTEDCSLEWSSKESSLMMIDAALESLGLAIDPERLDEPLKQIGDGVNTHSMAATRSRNSCNEDLILTSRDFVFIKECILGRPLELEGSEGFIGRQANKEWLYEVINDPRTGIDVDKMDSVARYQRRAFPHSGGEIDKVLVEYAFVAASESTDHSRFRHPGSKGKRLVIQYREEALWACAALKRMYSEIREKCLHHETYVSVSRMIRDSLRLANKNFKVAINVIHDSPSTCLLSEAVSNKYAMLRLTDSIIDLIGLTTDPHLEKARSIVHRIASNDRYSVVMEQGLNLLGREREFTWSKSAHEMEVEMLEFAHNCSLEKSDFFVQKLDTSCERTDINCVSNMRFLTAAQTADIGSKGIDELPEAVEIKEFSCKVRIFSKHTTKNHLVARMFSLWVERNGGEAGSSLLPVPQYEPGARRQLSPSDARIVRDEVHGMIRLCPVLVALVDTPQFHRLRGVKQLGTTGYVYINANHNRFEHSIGVAHLAERLCRRIMENQRRLPCTQKDKLCVVIAAVFHDLGHGCFSHIFEGVVNKMNTVWAHEECSLMMIDAALEHLGLAINLQDLDSPLRQLNDGVDAHSMKVFTPILGEDNDDLILTSRDFIFIKECILGSPLKGNKGFIGRQKNKEWLYDIVSNRHSGLDVDKIDYFARDQRRALRDSGEIDKVMIENAVVAIGEYTNKDGNVSRHLTLCYPEKMVSACINFFKKRLELHDKLYLHKTSVAISSMVQDILLLADRSFTIPTTDGEPGVPPSRAVFNKNSMVRLNDAIIAGIANTTNPELVEPRRLIHRIATRDLYKCVDEKRLLVAVNSVHKEIWDETEDDIEQEIIRCTDGGTLQENDFFVEKFKIHHGKKDMSPVVNMRFLSKNQLQSLSSKDVDDLPVAMKIEKSDFADELSEPYLQRFKLRIYVKTTAKKQIVQEAFRRWCTKRTAEHQSVGEASFQTQGESPDSGPAMLTQESIDDNVESDDEEADYFL